MRCLCRIVTTFQRVTPASHQHESPAGISWNCPPSPRTLAAASGGPRRAALLLPARGGGPTAGEGGERRLRTAGRARAGPSLLIANGACKKADASSRGGGCTDRDRGGRTPQSHARRNRTGRSRNALPPVFIQQFSDFSQIDKML